MVRVGLTKQRAELALNNPLVCPFGGVAVDAEHIHRPGDGVVPGPQVGQIGRSPAHHERDEPSIDVAAPHQGVLHGIEDRPFGRLWQRCRRIERAERELHGTPQIVGEVEFEHSIDRDEALDAQRQPYSIPLETVPNPRLDDSPANGQRVEDVYEILSELSGDIGSGVGNDAGKEDATGARGRVDGEVSGAKCHPPGGSDRSRMIDLELCDNHEGPYRTVRDGRNESPGRAMSKDFDIDEYRVKPGSKLDLDGLDTRATKFWDADDREGADAQLLALNDRLEALQELLWAQGSERVLIVLQAMDAGGKDGTVKRGARGRESVGG